MNSLRELLIESPAAAEQPRITSIREPIPRPTVSGAVMVRDEQIHALAQQLFFRGESKPVRHVAFAPIDASIATAGLCLEVAQSVAEQGRYDVGLIDAHSESVALQTELKIPSASRTESNWAITPRLWMVPRESWLPDASGGGISDQNLTRLRELTTEFDFCILWCAPVSWLTASISRTCDGVVLVLSANQTRRQVAAQVKDRLSKARVPLLGTVLANRRFPVPQGLYRNL